MYCTPRSSASSTPAFRRPSVHKRIIDPCVSQNRLAHERIVDRVFRKSTAHKRIIDTRESKSPHPQAHR
jgi:hypothetical protein